MRDFGMFLVDQTLEQHQRRQLRCERAVAEIAAPLVAALRSARALARSDVSHALDLAQMQVRQAVGDVSELEDFEISQFFERLNAKVVSCLRAVKPVGFHDEPSMAA